MSQKSYVATNNCLYCGEVKEIILDRRLKDTLENGVYDTEPCDKCKENMAKGFTFFEANRDRVPTGNMWVITMDAAERIISKDFLDTCPDNICFVEKETAEEIGLYQLAKGGDANE